MKFIRQNIIIRFLTLALAIHIMNCSVKAPLLQECFFSNKISFNKMESFLEIVLEQVFNFKNAIAEQNDENAEVSFCMDIKLDVDLFHLNYITNMSNLHCFPIINIPSEYKEHLFSQYHPEICPPPPKV